MSQRKLAVLPAGLYGVPVFAGPHWHEPSFFSDDQAGPLGRGVSVRPNRPVMLEWIRVGHEDGWEKSRPA